MSSSSSYYHQIKANSMEKYRDVQPLDFQADIDDKVAHIQSLFTHRTPASTGIWSHGDENITISSVEFTMFCVDGEPREFTTWFDREGQSKSVIPNHRANAMFDIGRFTSIECINFSNNRNQSLKEHQGCNFVYGDVVCEVPIGTPGPDHSVYNNNPLGSIMQPREPSSEMVNAHGQVLAVNKLVPTKKYNISASITTGEPVWEDTTYFVTPKHCNNIEFKFRLQGWGVTPDELTRLFENLKEPQEYAIALQYTREWSELDQSDRDNIWRLEYKPGTSNSACYNQHGMQISTDNTYEMVFNNKPRTAQRRQFIEAMKEYEDPPDTTVIFSLADLETQLSFSLSKNAALIYWNHDQNGFDFLLSSDGTKWRDEMRLVRDFYRDGRITSLSAGEPLHINGTVLYPIEVMYRQPRECVAYFLVRRRGDSNDYKKTPYFFVSESNRDKVLGYLTRGRHI